MSEEKWIIVDDNGNPLPDKHFYRYDRVTNEHFAPYSNVPMTDDEIIENYKNGGPFIFWPKHVQDLYTKRENLTDEEILSLGGSITKIVKFSSPNWNTKDEKEK